MARKEGQFWISRLQNRLKFFINGRVRTAYTFPVYKAGEALVLGDAVSLNSDGKLVKTNSKIHRITVGFADRTVVLDEDVEAIPSGTVVMEGQDFTGQVGKALFVSNTNGKLTTDEVEATRGNRFMIEVGTVTGATTFEALIGGSGGGLGGHPLTEYIAGEFITAGSCLAIAKGGFQQSAIVDYDFADIPSVGSLAGEYLIQTRESKIVFWFSVDTSGGKVGIAPTDINDVSTLIEVNLSESDTSIDVMNKFKLIHATIFTNCVLEDISTTKFRYTDNANIPATIETNSSIKFEIIRKGANTIAGEVIVADYREVERLDIVGFGADTFTVAKGNTIKVQKIGNLDNIISGDLVSGMPIFAGRYGDIQSDELHIVEGTYRIFLGIARDTDSIDITVTEAVLNSAIQSYYDSVPVGTVLRIIGIGSPTGYLPVDSTYDPVKYPEIHQKLSEISFPYGVNTLPSGNADEHVKVRTVDRMTLESNNKLDQRLTALELI